MTNRFYEAIENGHTADNLRVLILEIYGQGRKTCGHVAGHVISYVSTINFTREKKIVPTRFTRGHQ